MQLAACQPKRDRTVALLGPIPFLMLIGVLLFALESLQRTDRTFA
jgi:hypothetical protein